MTFLQKLKWVVDVRSRKEYGTIEQSFKDIAAKWSVTLGIKVSEKQVALCFIDAKTVREKYKHKPDNPLDMAGYAYCLSKLFKDKFKKKKKASSKRKRRKIKW